MPPSPMSAAAPVTDRPHLPFRPDIEGMRAVAVLLVVAAHAGVPWLQGGYIGVDVFFVISGYLITGLLVKEQEATGRIALLSFYARRLLRLMPALVVVVVVTCLAALVLLAPFEHGRQAIGAIGAITWTSNIQFALENVGYFDAGSQENLFLHTWSLGVEEQFYLLWPLLLIYAAWTTRAAPHKRQRRLLTDIATVGVLSFVACVYLTAAEPKLAFYLVFSRAWQFAVGALVWVFLRDGQVGTIHATGRLPLASPLAASLGIMVIIACAVGFGHDIPFPGWRATLPSLATALVIASGSPAREHTAFRVLKSGPMVAIGGLSYAWYLWHWPALLLGRAILPAPGWRILLLLALLSLGLAWATRRYIEQPMRRWRVLEGRAGRVIPVAVALTMAGVFGATSWNRASAVWAAHPSQAAIASSRGDAAPIYADACDQWFQSDALVKCDYGDSRSSRTVVLLGDSAAGQWFTALRAKFPEPQWRIRVITKSACPMVDVPFFYQRIGRRYLECERWRVRALQELVSARPDAIVFGSASGYPFTPEEWRSGSERIMRRLAAASGDVTMIAPLPVPAFDPPACVARDAWRERFGTGALCVSVDSEPRGDEIRAILADVARQAGIKVFDYTGIVCPDGWCAAMQDVLVYRDRRHLTETFVRTRSGDVAARWPGEPSDAGAQRLP